MLSFLRWLFGSKRKTEYSSPQPSARLQSLPSAKKPALTEREARQGLDQLSTAKVLHILDGDTVEVQLGRTRIRLRLDSIDCPEDGQEWGHTAAAGLIRLIGGRTVTLEDHGWDDHGRKLATLYLKGSVADEWVNVNERMVMLGHAWVMRRYYDHLPADRRAKLDRLENWARSKRVGLWSTPNPQPPWRWRIATKNRTASS